MSRKIGGMWMHENKNNNRDNNEKKHRQEKNIKY